MIWLVVLQYFFLSLKKKDFIYLGGGEQREKEGNRFHAEPDERLSLRTLKS